MHPKPSFCHPNGFSHPTVPTIPALSSVLDAPSFRMALDIPAALFRPIAPYPYPAIVKPEPYELCGAFAYGALRKPFGYLPYLRLTLIQKPNISLRSVRHRPEPIAFEGCGCTFAHLLSPLPKSMLLVSSSSSSDQRSSPKSEKSITSKLSHQTRPQNAAHTTTAITIQIGQHISVPKPLRYLAASNCLSVAVRPLVR